ncbi:MAG: hypothetical protein ABL930_05060 [Pseudobdellovibrio sp.]
MLNKMVLLSLLLFSVAGFSQTSAFVLQDGSVAKCNESGDAGGRAFRIKVLSSDAAQVTMKLDTLICVQNNQSSILVPNPLANKAMYNNQKDILTYEISSAFIQVTNDEGTQELAQINIDTKLASQIIVLKTAGINLATVDMTIQALQIIKINNLFFDQGLIFGGRYRLNRK